MDIYSKILAALASGEKTRSELAIAIKAPPPKVAGALVTLVSTGQAAATGKARHKGKDVTIYGIAVQADDEPVEEVVVPYKALTDKAIAELKAPTKLYLVWGGYAPLDIPPSKEFVVMQHTQS